MMSFRGAIFDLDGVLVDTVPLHFWAWQTMFDLHRIAFDEDDYRQKVDGRTRLDGVRAMMPDADQSTVIAASEQKQSLFLDRLAKGLKVFESSIRLVHTLGDAGIELAVASSSANLRPILVQAGIDHRFKSIVSGTDIVKGKPDPEIFLKAAGELGLTADDCVVFEDAASGVAAAKRGGFYCIGIDRNRNPERLHGADIIVDDLAELDPTKFFDISGSGSVS